MITNFRFSPGVSAKSIAHIKHEVHRLRAMAPADASCSAGIEAMPPQSYRSWVEFVSKSKRFYAAKMSMDELGAVDRVVSAVELQIEDWSKARNLEPQFMSTPS